MGEREQRMGKKKLSVNPWTAVSTNLAAGHPVSPAPFSFSFCFPEIHKPIHSCSIRVSFCATRGLTPRFRGYSGDASLVRSR